MAESTYDFDVRAEATCMAGWKFTVTNCIVTALEIRERDASQGCKGYPQMLKLLMAGHALADLDPDVLDAVSCSREFSCGRALTRCIREMRG